MNGDQLSPSDAARVCERVAHDLAKQLSTPVPDPATSARLGRFFTLLLTWNQRINLTGAGDLETLIGEHLPDSMVLAAATEPDAGVLDVGSGGGLPALPLAILRPDLRLTLVEPRAKRVAFLRTALRESGVRGGEVLAIRLEQLPESRRGRFQAACSRATFAPAEWLPLALPLVEPGGSVFLLGTPESVEAAGTGQVQGWRYSLPAGQARILAAFQRST